MRRKNSSARFVVCVKNKNYPASLEVRKIYRSIADASASAHHLVRVIDESGEDYLYPREWFLSIELSERVEEAIAAITSR